MGSDFITNLSITTLRCAAAIISNKSLLKSLAVTIFGLFVFVGTMMHPLEVQGKSLSAQNTSVDELMSKIKERLNLTDEQVTKVQAILEESFKKRRYMSLYIEQQSTGQEDHKSELQQLQWTTDIQLGQILTADQMKEYQKIK